MDKENLVYKLTSDIFKKYELSVLEEKYQLYGGKLISTIFNEIYNTINLISDNTNSENQTPVIFYGENELLD